MKRSGYTLSLILAALLLIGGMVLCDQSAQTASDGGKRPGPTMGTDLPRLDSRLDAIARAAAHPY